MVKHLSLMVMTPWATRSSETVNAKYSNPQTGWKTGILHMNNVKLRNTSVNNEPTNRVRAGKNGSNGSGSL